MINAIIMNGECLDAEKNEILLGTDPVTLCVSEFVLWAACLGAPLSLETAQTRFEQAKAVYLQVRRKVGGIAASAIRKIELALNAADFKTTLQSLFEKKIATQHQGVSRFDAVVDAYIDKFVCEANCVKEKSEEVLAYFDKGIDCGDEIIKALSVTAKRVLYMLVNTSHALSISVIAHGFVCFDSMPRKMTEEPHHMHSILVIFTAQLYQKPHHEKTEYLFGYNDWRMLLEAITELHNKKLIVVNDETI